ncbi:MAG: phosphate regulon transcriptional regulatory protein PhoB [Gammaproteobacteria bacterium CG22_combo_CG10-13_8_21_14_all_40_8]|nr:MAG: phosphate regulon transcriptional regulatory protein PhoB [Gammaproteobacteria bacterium CG22_combo_CG10-13_8_21_14_all_40_8]
MSTKILIIEDEAPIREMLIFALQMEGFDFLEASTAEQGRSVLNRCIEEHTTLPDLILLDWMLPGASGIDLAKKLKKIPELELIPIIILTARGEEDDRINGLNSGADDYVIKPFSPKELIARIHAVLRRHSKKTPTELKAGKIRLELGGHRVYIDGTETHIGPTEFKLLQFLLEHADRVFSRTQLLDAVWGQQIAVEERTVDVHILRLRKVLKQAGNQIQTVRGAGYRLSK